MPLWFRMSLGCGVFAVWAAACIVTWIKPDYSIPLSVQVALSLIVGAVFAGGVFNVVRFTFGGAEAEMKRDDDRGDPPKHD